MLPTALLLQAAIVDLLIKGMARGGGGGGPASKSSELMLTGSKPAVLLIVGVNGAGKVRNSLSLS